MCTLCNPLYACRRNEDELTNFFCYGSSMASTIMETCSGGEGAFVAVVSGSAQAVVESGIESHPLAQLLPCGIGFKGGAVKAGEFLSAVFSDCEGRVVLFHEFCRWGRFGRFGRGGGVSCCKGTKKRRKSFLFTDITGKNGTERNANARKRK